MPWLAVVGLGEDGPDGLAEAARALIDGAEVLVGGHRHLAMIDAGDRPALSWESPLSRTVEAIATHEGRRVCVLATGDPMHYGIGVTLARRFGREALVVLPAPSAFSLACARLAWPLASTIQLTVHGRPPELVLAHLAPGQKMLVLSTTRRRHQPSAACSARQVTVQARSMCCVTWAAAGSVC